MSSLSPSKKDNTLPIVLGIAIAGGLIIWVGARSIKKHEKNRE